MNNLVISMVCNAILLLFPVSCVSVESDLSLRLSIGFDKKINISLINNSNRDKYLMLPLNVTMSDGGAGVEYVVTGGSKKAHYLCSNINPLRAMKVERLEKAEAVSVSYTVEIMAKMYCLEEGDYEISAIYHNIINGKAEDEVYSNTVRVHVSPGQSVGHGPSPVE